MNLKQHNSDTCLDGFCATDWLEQVVALEENLIVGQELAITRLEIVHQASQHRLAERFMPDKANRLTLTEACIGALTRHEKVLANAWTSRHRALTNLARLNSRS